MLVEHGDETFGQPVELIKPARQQFIQLMLVFQRQRAPTLWIISSDASALGVKAGLLSTAIIWDGTMTIWVTCSRSISRITRSTLNVSCRRYVPPRYIHGIRSKHGAVE